MIYWEKKQALVKEVAEITERAMRGELDFRQALNERVATLKGLPESIFDKVYARIHFNKGAKELVDELHARGFKVGLVSGGFHETVDRLAAEAGIVSLGHDRFAAAFASILLNHELLKPNYLKATMYSSPIHGSRY